jgi:hypothetical protein
MDSGQRAIDRRSQSAGGSAVLSCSGFRQLFPIATWEKNDFFLFSYLFLLIWSDEEKQGLVNLNVLDVL